LAGYEKPEDLLGEDGLFKQLKRIDKLPHVSSILGAACANSRRAPQ
jgi:hypothetical protein